MSSSTPCRILSQAPEAEDVQLTCHWVGTCESELRRLWAGTLVIGGLLFVGCATAGVASGATPGSANPDLPVDHTITIFDDDSVDVRAERLSGPPPRYPLGMRQDGCQGGVELRFVIMPSGEVNRPSITILRSADERFSRAAVGMILNSRFKPGMMGSAPVYTRVKMSITFSIATEPPIRDPYQLQCR